MYSISIKKSALKELSRIPALYKTEIAEAIDALATNPRPLGVEKLKTEDAYRIRIAAYRVVYTIEDAINIVEVQRISHRKDVYKS